jgi:signal transduction histidine kinase/CheY-like chemotaxis protein
MKKILPFLVAITLLVVLFTFYLSFAVYKKHLNFQQVYLNSEASAAAENMEKVFGKFETDCRTLLSANPIPKLDGLNGTPEEELHDLTMFFSNYKVLVRNIVIYDNEKNVLNLSYDKNNKLLIDSYITQRQNDITEKEGFRIEDNSYTYRYPVFTDGLLTANLVFTFDFENFARVIFDRYHHDRNFVQWLADSTGNVIQQSGTEVIKSTDPKIAAGMRNDTVTFIDHDLTIGNKNFAFLTSLIPIRAFNFHFGLAFSVRKGFLYGLVFDNSLLIAVISTLWFAILLAVIFLLVRNGGDIRRKKEGADISHLQAIFDNLPVGILVMDQLHQTRIVNHTAREMLLVKDPADLAGKDLSDRFLESHDYYDTGSENAFDSNQFVLYKHEGEEVVVYKKEVPVIISGEEFIVSVFTDVTPIEKSRKYEAAANNAKSEFLAKMSHEIRTPMNGIIGMTQALEQNNLSAEQKEYLQIVKRSADLLLNLIDDILDFSKIEAGKMQLEEIPFKLREEVKLAIDLFRPIIEEKHVALETVIPANVPEHIIGDPFRLRQVLSNLISNAVKFTHEGKIVIGIRLEESYNGNLTLLFSVEDTGVGIPRNKIENIFSSFTQAEESTSRKYGGSGLGTTISKQLVNLMHGEIWVESPSSLSTNPANPGTKFSFTIEVYSNEKLAKEIRNDHLLRLDQLKVLVVTSPSQNRLRLLRLFDHEKIGYEVLEYHPAQYHELTDKLKGGAFQTIVILDDPAMNGIHLSKLMAEDHLTDTHLMLMISSNHRSENFLQSRRNGIDYYLVEPFEQKDVMGCIYESFPSVARSERESVRKVSAELAILVAEDNEINIRVAQTIFAGLGYKIDIAHNGIEAVDMAKAKHYDIIFMDLLMPERDGIQATVELRGLGFQMPVVAMTATASNKSRQKAISSGMNDYVVKPVRPDAIRNLLIKWFA